ncbi:MAG: cell wall-binding repeat-containing protein [Peptostreptococcus sp.]|uniref:cell wall-binding repeat-containing protein n=1 Tax=Peptostreptococcus sp. TaxID=1262 RepID=UPI002FC899DB
MRKTLFQRAISISMALLLALSSTMPVLASDVEDASRSKESFDTELTFINSENFKEGENSIKKNSNPIFTFETGRLNLKGNTEYEMDFPYNDLQGVGEIEGEGSQKIQYQISDGKLKLITPKDSDGLITTDGLSLDSYMSPSSEKVSIDKYLVSRYGFEMSGPIYKKYEENQNYNESAEFTLSKIEGHIFDYENISLKSNNTNFIVEKVNESDTSISYKVTLKDGVKGLNRASISVSDKVNTESKSIELGIEEKEVPDPAIANRKFSFNQDGDLVSKFQVINIDEEIDSIKINEKLELPEGLSELISEEEISKDTVLKRNEKGNFIYERVIPVESLEKLAPEILESLNNKNIKSIITFNEDKTNTKETPVKTRIIKNRIKEEGDTSTWRVVLNPYNKAIGAEKFSDTITAKENGADIEIKDIKVFLEDKSSNKKDITDSVKISSEGKNINMEFGDLDSKITSMKEVLKTPIHKDLDFPYLYVRASEKEIKNNPAYPLGYNEYEDPFLDISDNYGFVIKKDASEIDEENLNEDVAENYKFDENNSGRRLIVEYDTVGKVKNNKAKFDYTKLPEAPIIVKGTIEPYFKAGKHESQNVTVDEESITQPDPEDNTQTKTYGTEKVSIPMSDDKTIVEHRILVNSLGNPSKNINVLDNYSSFYSKNIIGKAVLYEVDSKEISDGNSKYLKEFSTENKKISDVKINNENGKLSFDIEEAKENVSYVLVFKSYIDGRISNNYNANNTVTATYKNPKKDSIERKSDTVNYNMGLSKSVSKDAENQSTRKYKLSINLKDLLGEKVSMDTKGIRIEDSLKFRDKRNFDPRFISVSDVKIDNEDVKLERQEDVEKDADGNVIGIKNIFSLTSSKNIPENMTIEYDVKFDTQELLKENEKSAIVDNAVVMNVKTKDNKQPKQEFILSSSASTTINKAQFSSPYFNVKLDKKVNGKETSDNFEFNLYEGDSVDSYKTINGSLSIKGLAFDKDFKLTETKKSGYEDLKDIKFSSKSQQNGVFSINTVEGFNDRVRFVGIEDKNGNKKEIKETDSEIIVSNKDTLILEISNKKTTTGGGGGGETPETEKATAVLANGKKYTDVLTATVLANERNCPILLTDTDNITDETLAELKRRGTGDVIISGGEKSVSKKVTDQLSDYNVIRYAGRDRYGTAREIGKEVRRLSGNEYSVMLVDGTNFPDVITISALATQKRAPILISEPQKLNKTTENTMKDWKINSVSIGGEKSSISKDIEDHLNKDLKIKSVERLGGKNRYETASIIGNEVREKSGNKNDMILVDGTDFPDGITINSLAAKYKCPIHLTEANKLNKTTSKDIEKWNINNIIVGGGEKSVSKDIYDGLKVDQKKRISGPNRYSTAVKISQEMSKFE